MISETMKPGAKIKSQKREKKTPLLSSCWDTFLFNALEKKILDGFAFGCTNRSLQKMSVLVDYTTPY